jgi:Flp pilus assembly secretin CpaC
MILAWRMLATLVIAGAIPGQAVHTVLLGAHAPIALDGHATRIALGSEEVAGAELLDTRHVLVLGRSPGVTTLIAWLEGGVVQHFQIQVTRDVSLLQQALAEIHPSITVALAPDRDALVLRGRVPEERHKVAAMAVALSYLAAAASTVVSEVPPAEGEAGALRIEPEVEQRQPAGQVIDLIHVESLAPPLEERIEVALRSVAGGDVRVRRVLADRLPDDRYDVLVLEGTVQTQVQLVRALQLAARLFLGRTAGESEIEVLADEGGGLLGQGGPASGLGSAAGSGSAGSFGGGSGAAGIGAGLTVQQNRIESNIGRASALAVADGRLLSFVEVVNAPQVRVGVQLYEVDRSKLLSFASEVHLLVGDFDQPPLGPAEAGEAIQPDPAAVGGFSNTDIQAGLSSLAEGFTQQVQVSGSHFAFDGLFRVLEARGIARRLSSPVLTVLSGEVAQFLVGGEVPVPQSFTPAGTTEVGLGTFTTVEFKGFGVGLAVRPLVGERDDLTLDLSSVVSAPDAPLTTLLRDTTGVDPQTTAFATRSLRTNARLQDGQSLLIGGLVSRSATTDRTKTPVLGDLPLLGWLFRTDVDNYDASELFVVLSPSIVREPLPGAAVWAQPELHAILESCRAAVQPRPAEAGSEASAENPRTPPAPPASPEQRS